MNLSCGSRTIKYLIFSFNFFFVITGIILIAVGASIHAYFVEYDYFLNNHYYSLPNLMIATGTIIFLVCFLGCYGAMKDSWIMLMGFSVLLGIIFIFEFSAGIAGYVLRDKTSSYIEESMQSSLQQYYKNDASATYMWDFVQRKFECCGVTSSDDWSAISGNNTLPISCCPQKDGQWSVFSCNNYHPSANVTTPPTVTTPTNVTTTANVTTTTNVTAPASDTTPATFTSSTNDTTPNITTTLKSSLRLSRQIAALSENTPIPSTTSPYDSGCEQAFGSWVKSHAVDIGAVCFTLAVLQLIGIGFACHLSKQLKNSYYST